MTSRSLPRRYLAEVLSLRILKESWDAAQYLIAAVAAGAAILTAVLHFKIGPVPWWLSLVPFGAFIVIYFFRNGYLVYKQEINRGMAQEREAASRLSALEQEAANREGALQREVASLRDPELSDRVLGIELAEQAIPEIGINAAGYRLGLRLTVRGDRGLWACQIKVESLEQLDGSRWTKAQRYGPEFLSIPSNIPAGASETCWVVSTNFNSPDDPRARLGQIPSLTKGTWRATLRVQAAGWRARHEVVEFALLAREPPFSHAPALRWTGRSARTSGEISE